LLPVALFSALGSVVVGVGKRCLAALGISDTPNLAVGRGGASYALSSAPASSSSLSSSAAALGGGKVAVVDSDLPGEQDALTVSRIPIAHAYIGDIFGFFSFLLKGWVVAFEEDKARHGPVFATNLGCPVLAALDAESAQTILRNVDNLKVAHAEVLLQPSLPNGGFNFTRKGPVAASVRRLHQALLPQKTSDASVATGLAAMKAELTRIAQLDASGLHKVKLVDTAARLSVAFASAMYLGAPLDFDLVDDVYPIPQLLPKYPSFPVGLLPAYYSMTVALESLFQQMALKPRYAEIVKAAAAVELDERMACQSIFTGFTLNAAGCNIAIVNAFFLLPLLPEGGQELIRPGGEALLDSFAWELLRHSGPTISRIMDEPTTVRTSAGATFQCKAGTRICTQLGAAMRDPHVWADPDCFKADRFVSPPPSRTLKARDPTTGAEPLPVLEFGSPLGMVDDAQQQASSHQCVFAGLAQPLLCEFIRLLVGNFSYRLDSDSATFLQKKGGAAGRLPTVDLSPSFLHGGTGKEFMPRLAEGTTFGLFTQKN